MSKQDQLNLEAVFRLKPHRYDTEGKADIKFVNYITKTDKLGDEPIELKITEAEKKAFGSNTHFMGKINGYDITVSAYYNNIVGNYLIKNQNLPVCSLQFMYSKNIVTGYLFNIFIYFCLDPHKNLFLKDPKSYVGATVNGKYVMVLDCDPEMTQDINTLIHSKINEYSTEDVARDITENNLELTEDELLEKINKDMEEKKTFYKSLIDGVEVKNFKNMKKFVDENLVPVYNNPHIVGLIKFALDVRAKKRIKEYGGVEGEYKIPTRSININDIKNNPELVDKYLGLDTDSDTE